MGYKTKFELLAVAITEYFICEDAKRAWLQDPKQYSPAKRFKEYAQITNSIREKKEEINKILKEFYERD